MSTVRIQVRRGLASEWTAANPILAAGEMGVETNTNKFKFGNGSSTWTALSYAAADTAAIGEISQDAIDTALSMGSGLTKTYDDNGNTITISVDTDFISTKSFATSQATAAQDAAAAYTDTAVNAVSNSLSGYIEVGERGVANGVASLNGSGKVPETELQLTGLTTSISTSGSVSAENITVAGNLVVNGTTTTLDTQNFTITDPMFYIGEDNNSNQLDLGFVAAHNDGTYNHTGLVRDASVGKWKLFTGVTDEPTTVINFAQGSLDNIAVGDLEASKVTSPWLSISGTVDLPAGTITEANLATSSVSADKIATDSVGATKLQTDSVSTTKIVDFAVTSGKIALGAVATDKIQDTAVTTDKLADGLVTSIKILDAAVSTSKLADESVTSAKIADLGVTTAKITTAGVTTEKIADLSVTETKLDNDAVTAIKIADASVVASKIANNSITDSHINPTAAIAQSKINGLEDALDLLASKNAPTFTGTVTLPGTTSIGLVSSTEIGYLDGVTSSVQTQINNAGTALNDHASDTTNVHGISDTSLLATTAQVATAKSEAIDAAAVASENYADGLATNYDAAGTAASSVSSHNNSTTSVHGIADTSKLVTTDAVSQTLDGNLVLSGNLTVNGTTTTVSTANFSTADALIYLGEGNSANTVDLGIVSSFVDGSGYQHSGVVRDASDNKWKFFKGVTDEPTTSINFSQGSLDDLAINNLTAAGIVFSDKTQTKAGVPSLTVIATAVSSSTTLDALGTDAAVRDSLVPLSGAVNVSFEATGNAKYAIGSSISFYQSSGTGANITGSGITILSTPGATLRTTNSSVTATKIAATTWLLAGDLKA